LAKILIVTEDKLIRWSLKEILTQEGYVTDTAPGQKDFLNKISNNLYDLILADFEMDRIKSIEMQEIMAGIPRSTKIIILSSFDDYQTETLLDGLNILTVIKKPFSVEQIKESAKKAFKLQNLR
jgi:DNA-binding NtrC family response regulator